MAAGARPAAAQEDGELDEFTVDWSTIDCGGGKADGLDELADEWNLEGTIGQMDAGMMEGGVDGTLRGVAEDGDVFTLKGGFWPATTTESACPADLDSDGDVDVDDMVQVITGWGGGGAADLTGDGIVGVDDLVSVITAWGECGTSQS